MRSKLLSAVIISVLSSSSALAADATATDPNASRIESVLVQVDTRGKVTEASPAYALSPALTQLLNANVQAMIHAPATDKNGKPIPSQFVMDVSLQSTPNGKGGYDAHFAYISSRTLPPGSWYWTHIPGDRVVLSNRSASSSSENRPVAPVQTAPSAATTMPSAPPSSGHTH